MQELIIDLIISPDRAGDIVASQTIADRIQMLEYVPTVLKGIRS